MEVEKTCSIDELYREVEDYDLVFTSEASLADVLNSRLEQPVLGEFAVTPMNYVFNRFQNEDVLSEKGLFKEIITETDLSWKQSSYILENVLDCWKNEGELENILDYQRFDNDAVKEVLDIIKDSRNVFSLMESTDIEGQDVAVVNYQQFNELDKKVLPGDFHRVGVFKNEKTSLPSFKLYNSTSEIVGAVLSNVDEEIAQDVAIVSERGSSYSTLVKSSLESQGINVMRKEGLSQEEDLRTFIQLLRLSLEQERLKVRECQPVLSKIEQKAPIELNNEYIQEIKTEELEDFKKLLQKIKNLTIEEAIQETEEFIELDLEEFEELQIMDEKVSEGTVNKIEYYLDTFDIETDAKGGGVLMVDVQGSAYIDRPIVFYLGMSSKWTPKIPNKPWIDKEEKDQRNLKDFKALIQNGEQKHFLVQNKKAGEEVTPCLYFNELTQKDFETFKDLEYEHYQNRSETSADGFDKQEYDVDVGEVELFSQSSLNTFVKSPKEYLFDKLTNSPDQDYFRKGTLLHDYAEFYANHPKTIEKHGREKFIQIILEEMQSIVDQLEHTKLETELEIGLKNIEKFIDEKLENETNIQSYKQIDYQKNFFAKKFNKEINKEFTEAWFENKKLGVKGIADLIINEKHLADYKSGKKKSANKKVEKSNLELLEDDPNFQAILYLTNLRKINPNQKLKFTFFHFLDNIKDEISGEADLEDNIVTINYYPETFNNYIQEKEVFNYIINGVKESNNRRKTLEKLTYDNYKEFFTDKQVENQYDKEAIQESELAEEFIEFAKSKVGDYKYVQKGCKDALKQIVYFRKENYFKEDLDKFENFLKTQLKLLNKYRKEEFPIQNPEIEEVDIQDLENNDMIPQ